MLSRFSASCNASKKTSASCVAWVSVCVCDTRGCAQHYFTLHDNVLRGLYSFAFLLRERRGQRCQIACHAGGCCKNKNTSQRSTSCLLPVPRRSQRRNQPHTTRMQDSRRILSSAVTLLSSTTRNMRAGGMGDVRFGTPHSERRGFFVRLSAHVTAPQGGCNGSVWVRALHKARQASCTLETCFHIENHLQTHTRQILLHLRQHGAVHMSSVPSTK